MAASDHAELSTLRGQLDELAARCSALLERYRDTPDSALAAELENAERQLVGARRALHRAAGMLD